MIPALQRNREEGGEAFKFKASVVSIVSPRLVTVTT